MKASQSWQTVNMFLIYLSAASCVAKHTGAAASSTNHGSIVAKSGSCVLTDNLAERAQGFLYSSVSKPAESGYKAVGMTPHKGGCVVEMRRFTGDKPFPHSSPLEGVAIDSNGKFISFESLVEVPSVIRATHYDYYFEAAGKNAVQLQKALYFRAHGATTINAKPSRIGKVSFDPTPGRKFQLTDLTIDLGGKVYGETHNVPGRWFDLDFDTTLVNAGGIVGSTADVVLEVDESGLAKESGSWGYCEHFSSEVIRRNHTPSDEVVPEQCKTWSFGELQQTMWLNKDKYPLQTVVGGPAAVTIQVPEPKGLKCIRLWCDQNRSLIDRYKPRIIDYRVKLR